MNETNFKGIFGVVTTASGAFVAWLPVVNTLVQIVAGLTAITVGIFTARYYSRKTNKIDKED